MTRHNTIQSQTNQLSQAEGVVLRQTLCFTSCHGQLLKTYKAEIYDREPWSIPPKFLLYKIQDSNRALHMVGTKSCRRKWVYPTGPKRSRFRPRSGNPDLVGSTAAHRNQAPCSSLYCIQRVFLLF